MNLVKISSDARADRGQTLTTFLSSVYPKTNISNKTQKNVFYNDYIFCIGYYSIVTMGTPAYHLERRQQSSTNSEAAVCTFGSGAAVSQGWGSVMSVHHSERLTRRGRPEV